MKKTLYLLFVLGLVLALACTLAATPISDIRANEDKFMGKDVTVAGTVEETVNPPLGNTDYFKVRDDSGEIWVATTGELPQKGNKIRVKGKVSPGVSIGSMQAGVIIKESPKR